MKIPRPYVAPLFLAFVGTAGAVISSMLGLGVRPWLGWIAVALFVVGVLFVGYGIFVGPAKMRAWRTRRLRRMAVERRASRQRGEIQVYGGSGVTEGVEWWWRSIAAWLAAFIILGVAGATATLSVHNLLTRLQVVGALTPADAPVVVTALVAIATAAGTLVGAVFLGLSRFTRARGAADHARGQGDQARQGGHADIIRAQAELRRAEAEVIRAQRGLDPLHPLPALPPSPDGASAAEPAP